MSSNYWESTQRRHWLFTREQLAAMRQKLETWVARLGAMSLDGTTATDGMAELLRLSKRLSVRQQAVATAQVYLKRFYLRVEIRRTNPYLVITTALYLACKMEEAPQHIRLIVAEARQLWQEFIGLDTSKIGECEFCLISEMNSQLIIHQPYRTLTALRGKLPLADEDVQLARTVVNDHYMTDLPLHFAPHIIALVAILLALVLKPTSSVPGQNPPIAVTAAGLVSAQAILNHTHCRQNRSSEPSSPSDSRVKQPEPRIAKVNSFVEWLSDSNVDIAAMVDVTQEIITFYECDEQYNEKLTREQISRFIKARSLDK